jgi:type IV pilus assembly protein PilY1
LKETTMNTKIHLALRVGTLAAAALIGALPAPSPAAQADLSQTPLATTSGNTVKPNINFVLDSSGSMAWSHAPDEAQPFVGSFGYASSQCNSIYYQPSIAYVPPKKADGTDYANATFTSALKDGYDTTSGTVNLSTSFYAYDNTTSFGGGTDTAQPAYYYVYSGNADPDYQNTTSQFYIECDMDVRTKNYTTVTITGTNSTKVNSITVGSTTITTGGTSSSTNPNTVASRMASAIGNGGYSAIASGNTVYIMSTNTSSLGLTPSINKSGSMNFAINQFITVPFRKVVVSSTSSPLGGDERQNFANFFTYYRTRILMMKSGAGRAFAGITSNYRVGFMTIYATPSNSTTDAQYLKISDFDQTQKNSWYSKFYAMDAGGGTPLKAALSTAGRNFAGKLGPDPMQYSCQQNFLILTTDGYWNAGSANPKKVDGTTDVGNQDGTLGGPGDYSMRDFFGATNTLADGAAYYYNTDIRQAAFGNCTSALTGQDVCADNVPPSATGNDTATTQHMTTFTLGLGTNGQLSFPDDLDGLVAGTTKWPVPTGDTLTTIDDLWHAAVNGHGQYFSAKNPDLLVSGLRQALYSVGAREAAGAAAATSNLEPVPGDNFAYVANYRTVMWDGDVEARSIDLGTGAIGTTAIWSAQALLDAQVQGMTDTRNIFTFLGGVQVPFLPASFTAAQKTAWFTPTASPPLTQSTLWSPVQAAAATADSLINYLRGQNGFDEDAANTPLTLYRKREHVLGDVIDGKPVYVKQQPFNYTENNYQSFKGTVTATRRGAVYIGANDGMLHAFWADTGDEIWAYVPSFVLPNLKVLADDSYATNHRYYVDGSPTVSDVWNGSAWRTVLVDGLSGGGKGYFALDVTDPSNPTVLWEFTDPNLGYSYGNPEITKVNGTWSVIFTSGYNNADGIGRLFIVNAYTGALIQTISTATGSATTPSNLGKLSTFVQDGLNDNTAIAVYAGDMLGNLWKFYPSTGAVVNMATLRSASGAIQPITTKPEVGQITLSSSATITVIFVGTGRYLGATDLADTTQQSLYGIEDLGAAYGNPRSSSLCRFVSQTLTAIDPSTRTTSNNSVNWALSAGPSNTCGWYLDFNIAATPGERVNVDPSLQLGVLTVATNIPENSVCTVGGSSFLYFFDYAKGTFVSTATGQVAGTKIGNAIAVGTNTYRLPDGRVVTTVTTSDDKHPVFGDPDNNPGPPTGKRVMWRELLQ